MSAASQYLLILFRANLKALPVGADPNLTPTGSTEVSETDVVRLYDFMYNNLADVKKALFQIRSPDDDPETPRARVQTLTTLTSQLGHSVRKDPANGLDVNPVQISASVSIEDYYEFMDKCKGRNIDTFNSAGIFYLAGVSRVRVPEGTD